MQGAFKLFEPSGHKITVNSAGIAAIEDDAAVLDPQIIFFAPHAATHADFDEGRVTLQDAIPNSQKLAKAAYLNMRPHAFLLIANSDPENAVAMDQVVQSFTAKGRVPVILGFYDFKPDDVDAPWFIVEGKRMPFSEIFVDQLLDQLDRAKACANLTASIALRSTVGNPDIVSDVGERKGLDWIQLRVNSNLKPALRDHLVIAALDATLRHPEMKAAMKRKNEDHFPPPREELVASTAPSHELLRHEMA